MGAARFDLGWLASQPPGGVMPPVEALPQYWPGPFESHPPAQGTINFKWERKAEN